MATRDARLALFLASLLLCGALGPAVAAGETGHASQQASLAPAQVDYDDVLLAVDLEEDGDASWRLAYRVRLNDDNTTQAFEDLRADIRENPENYTGQFRERMGRTAASASNATGREMAIRNVTVAAETEQLPREYGVVTYRFTWTNFAAVDGERLRAGDAISGFFLDESTTLLVTWPEDYRLESVAPRDPATMGTDRVTWSGPLEFTDGEPRLVLAPGTTTGEPTTPDTAGGFPLVPTLGVTLLLALGVAGFLYTRRRSAGRPDSDGGSEASVDGRDSGDGPAAGANAGASAAGTTDGTDAAASAADEEGPPAELLSNEEQVLKLLEDNGGRMKQQQVVAELDWTEAKTSQVIGGMREEGEVETFRIGRENVVTLPDEEI
jgi:hypothetical protein